MIRGTLLDRLTFLDLIYAVPIGAVATQVTGADVSRVSEADWGTIAVIMTVTVFSWVGLHQNRAQLADRAKIDTEAAKLDFWSLRFVQFTVEVVIIVTYFSMTLKLELPSSPSSKVPLFPETWLIGNLVVMYFAYLLWDILDWAQAKWRQRNTVGEVWLQADRWRRDALIGGIVTLIGSIVIVAIYEVVRANPPNTSHSAVRWSIGLLAVLYAYRVAQEISKQHWGKGVTNKMNADDEAELKQRAFEAIHRAYAPSGIHVGAAIWVEGHGIVEGVNVENASYGLTMCAERVAVGNAVTIFGPDMRVLAVALASDRPDVRSPCGACRQVLYQFGPDATLFLPGGETTMLNELLPNAFRLD